jgi:hypothetical protein
MLELVVLENTGDNTYVEVAHPRYGNSINYAGPVTSGDLDGDGRGDIVTGDSGGNLFVIESTGDDTYELVWEMNVAAYNVTALEVIGDADGDGLLEFAALILHQGMPEQFTVFESIADNEYVPVFSGSLPSAGSEALHVGDFDGDGRNEVVIGVGSRIQIWKAVANDRWEMVWEAPAGCRYHIGAVVGDLNNNGFGEILYTNAWPDNYHSFLVEWPFRVDASQNDLDRPGDAIFTFRDIEALRRIRIGLGPRDITRRVIERYRMGDPRVTVSVEGDETVLRLDLPALGVPGGRNFRMSLSARDRQTGEVVEDRFTYVAP